ncbi:MAG TPA: phasin, partial [Xanthobacteraceae bacterium]|nr:phasin [Xanthobacteraceae bacterium]
MAIKTGLEIPPEMRAFAEKSVGEARRAFEAYMDAATKALGNVEQSAQAMQSNARDLGRKAIGFAEDNVSATLDFAQ